MLSFKRSYWDIENGAHQRLDCSRLQEDKSRVRTRNNAHNLGLFRRAALSLARHWINHQPNEKGDHQRIHRRHAQRWIRTRLPAGNLKIPKLVAVKGKENHMNQSCNFLYPEDDFTQRDRIVQLGVPPIHIDFITSIDGVEWDAAWENREKGNWANVPVAYLSRDDFIANKRSSGRLKDLADIESLGEEP